ncbi:hypothetical protein, conserved [Entamoeba dispar SAW760]|uniref:TCTP domain-containing protein n=1 Tax=Entamoeba dispar (strain ATCC PRA-260 / SAW760) TaxID=370354 RepID=B0EQ45_ENTDS|nr:uncharacterized protein EDI_150820 [Entamoeba dispar SAW760]EDR23333.1 hypothetical protein, conserved [Entamoeba dispar SAW760]|eukprot:EDR23333.1 hypothetical protein, conserved [Entamoeba dispar SAW760]
MIVFADIFTDDEMFSDSFNPTVEGCMYVVKAKFVVKKEEDFGIACNADEDAEEGAAGEAGEANAEKVIDVVDNAHLVEQAFTKTEYMAHIKGYMKKMADYLQQNHPEKLDQFKVDATAFVKKVIGAFKDCSFYSGESCDTDNGMVAVAMYHDGVNPTFYFFKDGLKENKY